MFQGSFKEISMAFYESSKGVQVRFKGFSISSMGVTSVFEISSTCVSDCLECV